MSSFTLIVILVSMALAFDFLNGFHDAANIVGTLISSGSATPRLAIAIVAFGEFVGPFLIGVAVATTIGKEIVSPESINAPILFAALLAGIIWNIMTWYLGLPSSSSHALIGGLIGSVWAAVGFSYIHITGLVKVISFLFGSVFAGIILGYLFMVAVRFFTSRASLKVNRFFKNIQLVTAVSLALGHGSNDAQKSMGIITMGLVALGFQQDFIVPWWVIISCAAAISIGTASGGWRIIRTVGGRIFRVRPVHAFTSQTSSALIILLSSIMGGPVSTSNVVSSTIMGVGSAEHISKVRWGVARSIMIGWLLTIPTTFIMAALFYRLINWVI